MTSAGGAPRARPCQGNKQTGHYSRPMTRPESIPTTVDLVVIGGGTAGLVAAKTAARFGVSTLLVERHRMGGDCLWTGCVPSKSLIAAAAVAAAGRTGGRLGVLTSDVAVDFGAVMAHVRQAIHTIEPADSVDAVRQTGAHVVLGDARFEGSRHLALTLPDGSAVAVRFAQAIIATGSAPVIPSIPGAENLAVLSSDDVWELESQPARLLVVGAGAIGCELSQAFARLGTRVTLVHRGPRILPKEDVVAAELVAAAMAADGVELRLGATIERVEPAADGLGGTARLSDGSTVDFDRMLVALGRRPRLDGLGLESTRVTLDDRGYIAVDASLRTTDRRIWAAGDVSGLPQFTHIAGVNGSIAATNAALGLRRTVDTEAVPRVTFTHPEVAVVGVSTDGAVERGFGVHEIEHAHVDRAIAEGETAGITRIVVDRRGRVRGALVVGPRAGETIGEAALAVRHGMRTRDLAAATHPYPTYSDALWNAAISDVRDRLGRGSTARVIAVLAAVRRIVTR